jgi:quinol monooxygenase YgiN
VQVCHDLFRVIRCRNGALRRGADVVTEGLLVRLEARPDQDEEVERFLVSALPLVQDEPATTAWFAVRFGRHEYGIFDVFPDESGRQAHLSGAVAKGLADRAKELFAEAPHIR